MQLLQHLTAQTRPQSQASESCGLTVPSMESTDMQLSANDPPDCVGTDTATPAQRLRGKRKPKLTNEGRSPNQDRKRTKKHTTTPAPRKSSVRSASKTACLYRPIHMTATFLQGLGLDLQKLYTSTRPAHLTQRAPAETSSKLVFTVPHLQPPTASKIISQRPLLPARKPSFERHHGGPRFTIYEDSTATHSHFPFRSNHPFFPRDLTLSTTHQGSDNPEANQENGYQRFQEIPALGLVDERAAGLVTATADEITVQSFAMKAKPEVSKQALDALRMMR